MLDLVLYFNSQSRSFKINEIIKLAKKLEHVKSKDDDRFLIVHTRGYDGKFRKLLELVSDIKHTKLKSNGEEIDDLEQFTLLYGCKKRIFCKGECDYLRNSWHTIIRYLTEDKEIIKENIEYQPQITENLFDVENYPEIIKDSNIKYFIIDKEELMNSMRTHSIRISRVCNKFDINIYLKKLEELPDEIKVERLTYEDIRKIKNEKELEDSMMALEYLIKKAGDEFENRLRKVLDDYLDRKI